MGGYTGGFGERHAYDFVEGFVAQGGGYELGRIEVFRDIPAVNYEFGTQEAIVIDASQPIVYQSFPYSGSAGSFLVSTVAPVPEPGTYVLMGLGLVALLLAKRRRA